MVHLNKNYSSNNQHSKLHAHKHGPFHIQTKINDNAYIIDNGTSQTHSMLQTSLSVT